MFEQSNDSLGSLEQTPKKSLNDWAHDLATALLGPIANLLTRGQISPNTVTFAGFTLNLFGGIVAALGKPQLAAALVIVGGILDGLDGVLARLSNQVTTFGAFLDSVLDRWSEIVVFLGLMLWYLQNDMPTEVILIFVSLAGSVLVSYTRARAEGVGAQCKRGLFTRLERVVVLVVGMLLKQVTIALWILAFFATFTAMQRIYFTWKYIQTNDM